MGALLAIIAISGSCRRHEESDIPGKYSIKLNWGMSTLDLRSDHSMDQEVISDKGKTQGVSGKWECSSIGSGCYLVLTPCLELADGSVGLRVISACGYNVEVWRWNGLMLTVASGQGLAYVKK